MSWSPETVEFNLSYVMHTVGPLGEITMPEFLLYLDNANAVAEHVPQPFLSK